MTSTDIIIDWELFPVIGQISEPLAASRFLLGICTQWKPRIKDNDEKALRVADLCVELMNKAFDAPGTYNEKRDRVNDVGVEVENSNFLGKF